MTLLQQALPAMGRTATRAMATVATARAPDTRPTVTVTQQSIHSVTTTASRLTGLHVLCSGVALGVAAVVVMLWIVFVVLLLLYVGLASGALAMALVAITLVAIVPIAVSSAAAMTQTLWLLTTTMVSAGTTPGV